jgi:hypothetical protein
MATVSPLPFEELARLASDYVTSQEGMLDYTAWMDFRRHGSLSRRSPRVAQGFLRLNLGCFRQEGRSDAFRCTR